MQCISLLLRIDGETLLQAVTRTSYWSPHDSAPHFYCKILSFKQCNIYSAVGFVLDGSLNKIRYDKVQWVWLLEVWTRKKLNVVIYMVYNL